MKILIKEVILTHIILSAMILRGAMCSRRAAGFFGAQSSLTGPRFRTDILPNWGGWTYTFYIESTVLLADRFSFAEWFSAA